MRISRCEVVVAERYVILLRWPPWNTSTLSSRSTRQLIRSLRCWPAGDGSWSRRAITAVSSCRRHWRHDVLGSVQCE